MTKVIITAQVEDAAKWESGFRTHVDLFKKQTIINPVQFSVNESNEVAIIFEPENLDKFKAVLNSPDSAEAMSFDGVKRETVKIFFLDKELQL